MKISKMNENVPEALQVLLTADVNVEKSYPLTAKNEYMAFRSNFKWRRNARFLLWKIFARKITGINSKLTGKRLTD